MRELYLMRHAKSSWKTGYASDFERPLNARGRRDAPRMGAWLAANRIVPDLILASPAERARQTVAAVHQALDETGEVWWEPRIYGATVAELLDVIREVPDEYTHVLMVGHNPGFAECVQALSGQALRMPTAAIAGIGLSAARWCDVRPGSGSLLWHITPKLLP